MLPLMPTAALKAGEVVAADAEPVEEARGVEVAAAEEPAAPELVGVTEPEPVAEAEAEAELEAEEDSLALELELALALALELLVSVALALVEEGALLLEVDELPLEVVSIGGTTMGWPAEEH